ncbi:MAG TPA: hypothetical protein VH186_12300 [Chloroflexia bacterium]|nr:hypothetical protein [Chloroflexia bacterium]
MPDGNAISLALKGEGPNPLDLLEEHLLCLLKRLDSDSQVD